MFNKLHCNKSPYPTFLLTSKSHALTSSVFVRPSVSVEFRGVVSIEDIPPNPYLPVASLTERASQRLSQLVNLLETVVAEHLSDLIVSILDCLAMIGRHRPLILFDVILPTFQRLVGAGKWLDSAIALHLRGFLGCALVSACHATCVALLRNIDPALENVPLENMIVSAKNEAITKAKTQKKSALVKNYLELPYDGDCLLSTEQVVAATEMAENDQTKFVEPYTLVGGGA